MPHHPLVIDAQAHAIVDAITRAATQNPIDHATLLAHGLGDAEVRVHRVHLPISYMATFTVEEQQPGILFRHLAVSMTESVDAGEHPHPAAVGEIMIEFGFINDRDNVHGWMETLSDGRLAVNVIEPMSGDWTACEDPPVLIETA